MTALESPQEEKCVAMFVTRLNVGNRQHNGLIADFIPLDAPSDGIRRAAGDASIKVAVSTEEVGAEDVRLQAVVIATDVPGADATRAYVVQTRFGTYDLLRAHRKGPRAATGSVEKQASRHAGLAGARRQILAVCGPTPRRARPARTWSLPRG